MERTLVRTETTAWGSITRVHPFPGGDKSNLLRRAVGFGGLLAAGWRAVPSRRRLVPSVGAVIAMSPPLTLGLTGWVAGRLRRCPMVFNIQDVFPDAAVETGAITNTRIIAAASWLERVSYRAADAVTVLSDDLRDNVVAKLAASAELGGGHRARDPELRRHRCDHARRPGHAVPRRTRARRWPGGALRRQRGFSQSLDLVLAAARELPDVDVPDQRQRRRPDVARSGGSRHRKRPIRRLHQPARLSELLATGDVHVVPLRRGLGGVSVPSKTYSIMAAGRPVVASIDPDTAVPRILAESGGGVAVPPDDPGLHRRDPVDGRRSGRRRRIGARGRAWVEREASPCRSGRRLRRPAAFAGLTPHPIRAPLASRGRGTLLVLHQESRQAGPVRQGQEGPLPGRNGVPRGRDHRDRARAGARRLRPPEPAVGRRLRRTAAVRSLAPRLRLLPLRHMVPARRRRRAAGHRQLHPVRPHRHPQPRRRLDPLAPVHLGRGRAAMPRSACSSTPTTSTWPTTSSSSPNRSDGARDAAGRPGSAPRGHLGWEDGDECTIDGSGRMPRSRWSCGTTSPTPTTAPPTSRTSTTSVSTVTRWSSRSPSCPTTPT